MVGPTFGGGKWRASRNGGWEGEFGGVCKMKACLEALLEMDFCTKPPNFGVEAHMEASAGDALSCNKHLHLKKLPYRCLLLALVRSIPDFQGCIDDSLVTYYLF
jgi:hypothetical protein